jgi:hypothetical protein
VVLLIFSWLSRELVRGSHPDRCSFDGVSIDRVHRVDLMEDGMVRASFCSVACALAWPKLPASRYWQVRDEMSGEPIDASRACFVLSRVVTVATRGERIHVFRQWTDAMNHCAQFGGARIADPFASEGQR